MTAFDDEYWWTRDRMVTTLSFVRGKTPEEVAAAMAGAAAGVALRLDQVDPWPTETAHGDAHRVQLADEGGWTVLVETHGSAGVYEPLVQRVSRAAAQVSLYCSVNSDMAFLYAKDGLVTRRFDPLLFPDEQAGVALPEEAGFVFGWKEDEDRAGRTPDPYRQAVLLVERLTNLRLTSQWLCETPRPVYLMPTDPSVALRVGVASPGGAAAYGRPPRT